MTASPRQSLGASKRLDWLIAQLATEGGVETRAAAQHWGCSVETIRKDLVALESRGLARRAHGGALRVYRLQPEIPLEERVTHTEEKRRIAQAALGELDEGSTIFLESGSTTGSLASLIPSHFALTVVTNSLPIAQTLLALPLVECHLIGGNVRPLTQATAGYWAMREMGDIAIDTAVLGTNAISSSGELSTPDAEEASIKALALGLGTKRILLADHSKFDTRARHRYGSLTEISLLITGDKASDSIDGLGENVPRETRFV